jgi:hypothetical protein
MNKIITYVFITSIFGVQSLCAMAGGQNLDQDLLEGASNFNLVQVQNALNQGANINAVDANNATALHRAAFNADADIAYHLIARGAGLNMADNFGNTPLHSAVMSGADDIVKLLLDRGADPTIRNNIGHTPADIVQIAMPEIQEDPTMERIRNYFVEAARPIPEEALGAVPKVATLQ